MYNKLLILYSGGSDSRLLLEMAKRTNNEIFCVLIDYGQLHNEELEYAKKQLQCLNVNYQIVEIKGLNIHSALTGNGDKGTYEGVSEWHVPGRNTMFLSIALSLAEANKCTKVWIGPDFSDRLGLFPDCFQEYIVKMRDIFQVAGSIPIELEAPLLGMTKQLVNDLLKSFNINHEDIFSGYGKLQS